MKEISPNTISIPDGTLVQVIIRDETLEGTYRCIKAYIPPSLKGYGICNVFSVKDRFTNETKEVCIEHVKHFFVLENL